MVNCNDKQSDHLSLMQVYKFLDKNYDQVRQDVLDLFIQSKNKVGLVLKLNLIDTIAKQCFCKVCINLCICVFPDGIEPLPGSCRGHGSAERSHKEEQHSHQKIPSSHRQQQVSTVPAGAGGEDGEVKYTCSLSDHNWFLLFSLKKIIMFLLFHFRCNPYFVRCIKPNNMKVDLKASYI